MSTATQYNPNRDLNAQLLEAGVSKTVYALVTPETEKAKRAVLEQDDYLDMFREAWTGKQDAIHVEMFDTWMEWSRPVVHLAPAFFPFRYPTAGASEGLRHLIYDLAAKHPYAGVHFFEGEYEGYKAMAEAAGIRWVEHPRSMWKIVRDGFGPDDLFFISQPSAIDGNVWHDYNEFILTMPDMSTVVDVTYVGAVPREAVQQRFDLSAAAIRNIVFSLSKPFGVYYDRVGGVFARSEDHGLFGNKWFKNLTSIRLGTILMERHSVFDFPERYGRLQREVVARVSDNLGLDLQPSDVFILAGGSGEGEVADYLRRARRVRLCLTPAMAKEIGTAP
jgi:hypothetical protein